MREIVVKEVYEDTRQYLDHQDNLKDVEPNTAYLVALKDGSNQHLRYVSDTFRVLSKQAGFTTTDVTSIEIIQAVDEAGALSQSASNPNNIYYTT